MSNVLCLQRTQLCKNLKIFRSNLLGLAFILHFTLLQNFTLMHFDDLMRIRTWHFAIRNHRELIPRSVIAMQVG